ncbi:MAG: ribonuclease D [Hyphomicrobiales bacterium]
MNIITDTQALTDFCNKISGEPYVTVDTEFLREKTYWSKLCLVQVASDNHEAIIDPLADGISLDPLIEILFNENILKVFHAARQDLEIFFNITGKVPTPIFDTQVAGMVAGFGESVGYERLVRDIMNVQIDKTSRFTDWSKRPLTNKQLKYALTDVTFLRDIYKHLVEILNENGRAHWLTQEMQILESASTYELKPENVWRRIKMRNIKKQHLGAIMKLAEWRENEARAKNVPRNRIIKDEAILEIAMQQPKNLQALGDLRSIPNGYARSEKAKNMFAQYQIGRKIPEEELPELSSGKPKQKADSGILEMMKVVLRLVCEKENVAAKLIANSADLEKIALDDNADVAALSGWRRETFGEVALSVKNGKSALRIQDGVVEIFKL